MTDESNMTYAIPRRLAARQGIGGRGLLHRAHRQHAHRLQSVGRADRLRRHHRLRAGARRAGHHGAANARMARRPQRLVVRVDHVERQQPAGIRDCRRRRRERAARDGAGHGERLAGGVARAQRTVGGLLAADDQGPAIRGVRGAERQLPGELRRRRGGATHHRRQRVAIRIERDRAMDHERGVQLAR